MTFKTIRKNKIDDEISELVTIERDLSRLRPMTDLERAKLEQGMAIDHLYYSSKIEGTHLSKAQIDKAIHGEGISPSEG